MRRPESINAKVQPGEGGVGLTGSGSGIGSARGSGAAGRRLVTSAVSGPAFTRMRAWASLAAVMKFTAWTAPRDSSVNCSAGQPPLFRGALLRRACQRWPVPTQGRFRLP